MLVTVCLCTYKRETLNETLASLIAQRLPSGCRLEVVVVDNDAEETGRATCEKFRHSQSDVEVRYFVNPERNLAAVRNSTIELAKGDYLAFIDDDEWAEPDWIAALLSAIEEYGADVVFGPVMVHYPEESPDWIVSGDMFGKDKHRTGQVLTKGATSNALLKAHWVRDRGIRFDAEFGKSGGEDTDFFHRIHKLGAHLVFDNRAVVSETVEKHRLNLDYLKKQNIRIGQTHWHYLWSKQSGLAFMKTGAFVLAQVVAAGCFALVSMPFGKSRYARWYLLLIRNIEKLKMAFGNSKKAVELYGNH
jgi:succinoglycan biosynthesis protein ExoM